MAEETQKMTDEQVDAISRAFVSARRSTKGLADYPGELPGNLAEAYAVQSRSIERWGDEVAGWKVGFISEPSSSRFGVNRLAGPVFSSAVLHVGAGEPVSMPAYAEGFAAVEAEFILEIGETVAPVARDWTEDDLKSIVRCMRVGVEVASSPLPSINDLGPCSVISDFGNNAGLVVGPDIPGWENLPLEELTARVDVEGRKIGQANASNVPGGPLGALRFLVDSFAGRGLTLEPGMYISTGAVTGVHQVPVPVATVSDFGIFGKLPVRFEPMQPRD